MNSKRIRIIAGLISVILFMVSCGQKTLGFGTILWSTDENLFPTGETVTVISESNLADVYLINNDSGNDPIQIARWRVNLFSDLSLATDYSKKVSKFKTIFARNLKDGLLIRKEPDINSERVYKMRKDQIIKVYGKSDNISTVGQYEGYWYNVITEDGTKGYCFDHYLDIYDSSISPEKKVDPAVLLARTAFTKIYHPSNFIDMINNNAVSLHNFNPEIGLFPDLENKTLKIVTPKYNISFSWNSLSLVDNRSFTIGDNDTVIHVLSDRKLQIDYYYQDQKIITNYYVIDNMEDIIQAETMRRESLYTSLLDAGPSFSSNAYGNIKMQMDGSFSWKGYDRLVPQIIPSGSNGTGRVRFDKFISNNLKENFTGIISFYFSYGDKYIPVFFLYNLDGKRLKLTFVPENHIDNMNIVGKKSISPVVIAFSAN